MKMKSELAQLKEEVSKLLCVTYIHTIMFVCLFVCLFVNLCLFACHGLLLYLLSCVLMSEIQVAGKITNDFSLFRTHCVVIGIRMNLCVSAHRTQMCLHQRRLR